MVVLIVHAELVVFSMGSFGGFYKGEKKKPKKGKEKQGAVVGLSAPTFVLPEIIGKKKPE